MTAPDFTNAQRVSKPLSDSAGRPEARKSAALIRYTRRLIAAGTWLRDNSLEIGVGFAAGMFATVGLAYVWSFFL